MLAEVLGQHLDREVGRDDPETTQEKSTATPTIQKMPPAYSPVVDCAKPMGMNAATVMSAPVSRGIAVAS